jgi:hypothetical protein
MSKASLREVLEKHRDSIMQIPGVIGVGIGLSQTDRTKRCIVVYTTTDQRPPALPREIEGYELEIVRKKKGFHAL